MALDILFGFELHTVLLAVIAVLAVVVLRSWLQTPGNLPPFPARPYPIVGHFPYLTGDMRQKMLEFRETTGDVFSMYFGTTLVVILNGYDVLKEALVKQADYFSDRSHTGMIAVAGYTEGLVSNSGASWKENRTTVLSILRGAGMGKKLMADRVMEEVKVYLGEITARQGKASNVRDITNKAIANIICSIVLGNRFENDDPLFIKLIQLFDEFVVMGSRGSLHQWFPFVKHLPGDLFGAKAMQKVIDDLIDQVKILLKTISDTDCLATSYNKEMSEKREAGVPTELSEKNLEYVMFDLLIAGSETTNTTILWFYLFMLHHPEVQKKMYDEIIREVGPTRDPTVEDKRRLNYTGAVIMETQRLSAITPYGALHRCSEDTTLRGYTIPKDTLVMKNLDTVQLSDEVWGDARAFRPERFLKDGQLTYPEHFTVFSIGRRACLGEALARLELFLFIVCVVQRFEILPAEPGVLPPQTASAGIAFPPIPFQVRLVERDAA